MEIGLPQIDIIGILTAVYDFLRTNLGRLFDWLMDWVGGNPIVAGIVIGFFIYVIADLSYHRFLDKPTAAFGERMMNSVKNFVIFIIILIVAIVLWKGIG